MLALALILIVALATLLLYVVLQNYLLKRELEQADVGASQLDLLQRQTLALQKKLARQQFTGRLIRELPLLVEQLHNRVQARRIPEMLLQVLVRSFEPRQAVVLLRRGSADSEPDRRSQLVVTAIHPQGLVKPGTRIQMGQGELGYVAEAQLTMSREDFDRYASFAAQQIRTENLPGFEPTLAAPMVFGDETVGVVALSGSPYEGGNTKRSLRLIAQIGAVAFHNVTAYGKMKLTANVDGLTRIYNKRHLLGALGEQIYQAEQDLSTLSVFLFDIDNFKNYNDVNGHIAGDELLKELAGLVKDNVRDENIFGRFGGEEFLVILLGTSTREAMLAAENIRSLIAGHNFPFAARQPLGVLSISGGVATYPSDAQDSVSLLRTADEALYAAKDKGRNRVLPSQKKYICEGRVPV